MPVDYFGRPHGNEMGPPGPKGDHGKGGMEQICQWIPDVVLHGFRENREACCLLLTDPKKDVKRSDSYITE